MHYKLWRKIKFKRKSNGLQIKTKIQIANAITSEH